MGNCVRSTIERLPRKHNSEKNITILIVGLGNAGKTLILNHICGDSDKHVLPTMGFRTVCLKYKSYSIKIYDLGGDIQIRSLWPKYYGDIHGLIYVVDASDISRLAENKVVFGELVEHENISGKPLLLLANKQDVTGAIDELDVVDNLDVEYLVNTTRCPTRVETCSCFYEKEKAKSNTLGITNGYKWLLDTILRNYTALNNRVKESQSTTNEELRNQRTTALTYSPSRLSVHSNPFKPIKELLSKNGEINTESSSANGIINGQPFKRIFMSRKTAPLPSEHTFNMCENMALYDNSNIVTTPVTQKSTQTINVLDLPQLDLHHIDKKSNKYHRPHTAPAHSRLSHTISIINMPGQVPQ